MHVPVEMTGPPSSTYAVLSGRTYTTDGNGRVAGVIEGDIRDLVIRGLVVSNPSASATYISWIRGQANELRLASGTPVNIGTIQVTAGAWLVWGEVWFDTTVGNTNVSWLAAALSMTSATFPSDPSDMQGMTSIEPNSSGPLLVNSNILALAPVRLVLDAPSVLYVVAQSNYTGGGYLSAFGKICGLMQQS